MLHEQDIEIANNILFNNHKLKNYIFIYTPPKVGSTSLVSSLRLALCHKYKIIHIHNDIMLEHITKIKGVSVMDIIKYNQQQGNTIYVIDIYRSPIERKISEYFEQLAIYHFNNTEENMILYPMKTIIQRFNDLYPHLANIDHSHSYYELTDELLLEPFNHTQKYIMQINNGITYIKLRLKDSNEWGQILTNIFNTKILILKDYETKNKIIGTLYQQFNQQYRIPINYFLEMQNNIYLKKYYSIEEQQEYIEKWRLLQSTNIYNAYMTNEQYHFYLQISLENQFYKSIQFSHYFDMGCICKACSMQRITIFNKINCGELINIEKDYISHSNATLKYKAIILKKIVSTQSNIQQITLAKNRGVKWGIQLN